MHLPCTHWRLLATHADAIDWSTIGLSLQLISDDADFVLEVVALVALFPMPPESAVRVAGGRRGTRARIAPPPAMRAGVCVCTLTMHGRARVTCA
jgi:hypothetical protein